MSGSRKKAEHERINVLIEEKQSVILGELAILEKELSTIEKTHPDFIAYNKLLAEINKLDKEAEALMAKKDPVKYGSAIVSKMGEISDRRVQIAAIELKSMKAPASEKNKFKGAGKSDMMKYGELKKLATQLSQEYKEICRGKTTSNIYKSQEFLEDLESFQNKLDTLKLTENSLLTQANLLKQTALEIKERIVTQIEFALKNPEGLTDQEVHNFEKIKRDLPTKVDSVIDKIDEKNMQTLVVKLDQENKRIAEMIDQAKAITKAKKIKEPEPPSTAKTMKALEPKDTLKKVQAAQRAAVKPPAPRHDSFRSNPAHDVAAKLVASKQKMLNRKSKKPKHMTHTRMA